MLVFPKLFYLTAEIYGNVFNDIWTYDCIQNRPQDVLKKTEDEVSVIEAMQDTAYSEAIK